MAVSSSSSIENLIREAIEKRTRAEGINLKRDYVHIVEMTDPRGPIHHYIHDSAWSLHPRAHLHPNQLRALASFVVLESGEVLKSRSSSLTVGENILRSGKGLGRKCLPLSSPLPDALPPPRHRCRCDIVELMRYGCRCGGI